MNGLNTASLINLLGFTVGIALYGLLLVMVMRHRKTQKFSSLDFLLLATSLLGVLWNLGELSVFVWRDFGQSAVSPVLTAISYSALGFLPSVVAHSAWKNAETETRNVRWLAIPAYGLSLVAAVLHFQSALFSGLAPSNSALQILTFGSLALLVGLLIFNFKQTREKKLVWASALLVFAVSALHLSGDAEENSWFIELVAHQSSLPLALVILYQDFRFAFADLFLKRALSLILLTLTAFGLYVFVAAPLLRYHETHDRNDVQAVSLIITLWVATALVYPALHKFAVWLVDKIILRRTNYETLRAEIAQEIEKRESAEEILREVCRRLAPALTAESASWSESRERKINMPFVNFTPHDAEIFVPVAEAPFYKINLKDFAGGRHLLSDEIKTLEAVGLLTARRIDAVRVTHERYTREIREQEFSKLATEAQLSALRAQINPHFLFNALTTIGYLIQAAPDKAFSTLMRLTQLLRGVLRSTGEFSTLEAELKLIDAYLEIEKTRFEERLRVCIEVPPDLLKIRVPSLILQPLIENAVKHGISESKTGGEIGIYAELENEPDGALLKLTVSNTGKGFDRAQYAERQKQGVGLSNIKQRLQNYYGNAARFNIESKNGTRAEILIPVTATENLTTRREEAKAQRK
ncbi:MAG TPA: histidine kinase [Pyrinomonadaceae bacterium]|jgi:anti-sigma regulatory factor (Ser/Thr protein kinase)